MRVWLDDERKMPEGFDLHVRTATEAIDVLKTGKVQLISLDHDLGPPEAGTGYDVAAWIEEAAFSKQIPRLEWRIHSANPVGRERMLAALVGANRWWNASTAATASKGEGVR